MTLHYHGTPITPNALLMGPLAGNCFCVCYHRPDQLRLALEVGQSVMGDCGAYPAYTALMREVKARAAAGNPMDEDERASRLALLQDWTPYYDWCLQIMRKPENWVVVPDVIGAGSQEQDRLLAQWPHGKRGAAPVYHLDEPPARLFRLLDDGWDKVCIGSTGEFWQIPPVTRSYDPADYPWEARMDDLWEEIDRRCQRTPLPWIHMLRGMQLSHGRWGFASVDSSDVGQNHNRLNVEDGSLIDCDHEKPSLVAAKARRWNAKQTPAHFSRPKSHHQNLLDLEAAE